MNTIMMELLQRAKPYRSPENIRELCIEDLGTTRFYLSKFADCLVAYVKNPRTVDGNLCNIRSWYFMSILEGRYKYYASLQGLTVWSECEPVWKNLQKTYSRKYGGLDIYRRVASTPGFQWIVPSGLSLEAGTFEILEWLSGLNCCIF